jgi:tyrosyl-tRNA synthetase
MNVVTDEKQIDAILDRGVLVNVLPDKEGFRKALLSGKRLRIYIGADPTSTSLHLSHAKNYMLLEEFRRLGHEAIVLFGDFTARIGDPTDRDSARTQLTSEAIIDNVKAWLDQIRPLLNFEDSANPARVVNNSEWLAPLTFEEVIRLASNFTVQQMIERDMFERRLKSNEPIHLHEFLYPLMQGYDSVALDVDVELCGTDQTFNALAGRTLQKRLNNKDKFVAVVNLLENPKTGELMSKSRGTGVFLNTSAGEMYGAIMAQADEMIELLLINNTRMPLDEIRSLDIAAQPRRAKARAAKEIVSLFYGSDAATSAEQQFERLFSSKSGPSDDDLVEKVLSKSNWAVDDLLVTIEAAESKSQARRLLEQGALKLGGTKLTADKIDIEDNATLQVGKRQFYKLRVK